MKITLHFFVIFFIFAINNCIFISKVNAQFTIKENFQGSSVGSNIILGGSPSAYLTSGVVDPVNGGWLRLTNANQDQKGFAYINSTFPSTLGALIDFEYKIWRDSIRGNPGADGIGIYFFDATKTFSLGGYGGSLGYAPNTTAGTTTGLAGGYMGIGLDEYGNFSNPTEGRNGGPGVRCNSITLRGPTTNKPNTTNDFLKTVQLQTSNTSNVNSIDYNTITKTRPTDSVFYRRVKISIIPIGSNQYTISVSWRTTPTGSDTPLLTYTTTTAPPANMKVGFAASTGASANYHEIRNVLITTPGGVRVDKTVDKPNAKVGDQLTYIINAYNSTTAALNNLILADTLKDANGNMLNPACFTVNSITFNNNGNSGNTAVGYTSGVPVLSGFTNPFSTKLNMDINSISTFKLVGTITNLPAGGTIVNSVGVDPTPTGITDTDLTNNYYSTSTQVLNADFVIKNQLDNNCVDTINGNTYSLQVSNNGTDKSVAGQIVKVTDNIPSGFTVTGASGTGWSVSNTGNNYSFTRSDALDFSGSYPPITINFKAPLSGTSVMNKATVSYTGIEATTRNNSDSVTLNGAPAAPVVNSPVTYCKGSAASALKANGNNLMWYSTVGGAGSTTAPIPNTAIAGSKTYYVSQNNGTCESPLSAILVKVNPSTTSVIDTIACISYKAPDGQVYTTSGVKTAVIPNKVGCDSTITINLTVNPIPTVTNTPLIETICSGTSTTLVTLTSDVASTTFEWTASTDTGITGFTTSGTNTIPAQTLTNPSNSIAGTVTYVIIPKANGCVGTAVNYVVTVNPKPITSGIYHQ